MRNRKNLKNLNSLIIHKSSYRYGLELIFYNINCTLQPGSVLVVKGENGTGKSTFLRCILNYIPFSNGKILSGNFLQKVCFKLSDKISSLTLEESLKYPFFRVVENIQFWANILSFKCLIHIDILLKLLYLLKCKKLPLEWLSLGQNKRLLIANLLAISNPIWVLDEPLLGLDNKSIKLIQILIKNHQKHTGSTIFVSHVALELHKSVSIQL